MKAVFADAVYFLALLNPADQLHPSATRLSQERLGPLLTTEFILTEVGDGMSRPANRPQFAQLIQVLRSQPDVEIIAASGELFRRGCELHRKRLDKEWSLTDCTSFVVMEERGLVDALTSDRHFEQAGFRPLIRQ